MNRQGKTHRNGRGLFVGAILGAVLGYLLIQNVWGIIFGALVGGAALYRLNPGPWRRD